ncbi:unnamed protein product [Lota lota]
MQMWYQGIQAARTKEHSCGGRLSDPLPSASPVPMPSCAESVTKQASRNTGQACTCAGPTLNGGFEAGTLNSAWRGEDGARRHRERTARDVSITTRDGSRERTAQDGCLSS